LFGIPYTLLTARAARENIRDKRDPIAALGYLISDFNLQYPQIKKYMVITAESYHAPLDFYKLKFSTEGDIIQDRRIENQTRDLQPGEVILTSEPELKNTLLLEYRVKRLHDSDYGIAVELLGRK
jgi:hypothetical protein